MKEVANKIPCWAEDKLYLMWVLLNNANTEKQHYFLDFFKYRDDFKHIRDVRGFVETVEQFGAKITDLDFDSTLFKDEEKRDHENFERDLLEESKEKKWEKSIKNILNNKFTLADFKSYLYDVDDNCLLYYIGFRLKLDQEKEKAFRKETNDYLDAFIEEKIYSEKQNIYTFEIHKRAGFGVIYEIYDSYGDHFVVDQEYKNIFAKQEFLFIHFFLALDRLGYLSVQNIELDDDTTHIGEKYKVRVQLLESFFQNTMREEEKKSKIEKQQAVTYKDGVLNFKNERIDFQNKQNQKELLDVLFEQPNKNWSYDEIEEKWDANSEFPQRYWRKFYTAGDGINTNISRQTTISDLIQKTTKNIWINKKYLADI